MTIREEYYRDDFLIGPFMFGFPEKGKSRSSVVRTECLGVTLTMSEEEGHQLGQALLNIITPEIKEKVTKEEELWARPSSSVGPWTIEVLEEEWEWEAARDGEPSVCVTYEKRFEFLLSWSEAFFLMEDYDTTFAEDYEEIKAKRIGEKRPQAHGKVPVIVPQGV